MNEHCGESGHNTILFGLKLVSLLICEVESYQMVYYSAFLPTQSVIFPVKRIQRKLGLAWLQFFIFLKNLVEVINSIAEIILTTKLITFKQMSSIYVKI